MNNVIVWDGFNVILLIIVGVICICFALGWLLTTFFDKIDKYFERRNHND